MNCKICDTEEGQELWGDKCTEIMKDTKKRVLIQRSLFDTLLDNVKTYTCKDCGVPRKKGSQYCKPCAKKRRNERNRQYAMRIRGTGERVCKNEKCKKPLINPKSNSQRYCSSECRPTKDYNERRLELEKEKRIKEKVQKMTADRYEGTINPYFLRRGKPSNNAKQSDTGGAFIY